MAGAKPGVHIIQLKPVTVPQFMQDGEKFVKWDEESGTAHPVSVKVDPSGYFLYWTNQNKEVDLLDLSSIRDTRSGRSAKVPKDAKLKQIVAMGSPNDTLEEKTLTIVSGPTFVNVTYLNFCCSKKETAKMWADELLTVAHNILQLNSPIISFLQKLHTKLSIMTDKQGRIPVKNIIKVFAKENKEDKKRVEKALDAAGLPTGKADTLNPTKFTFEEFFSFYKILTTRSEVEKVFDDITQRNPKKLMSAEQFTKFINNEQRDPRLNEILYPYATQDKAKELIEQYEMNKFNASRSLLSLDGFLRYLLSEDNSIVSMEKYDLSEMDEPLNHYFINSSHNTYLTGHQLTGKSSVEMYRQSLVAGCRCVELDLWNGKSEEPVIVHGFTLVPDLAVKDVIEAIADSAFKTSDYPVILSFENHCNTKQQAKIAQYCREYFGSMLLDLALDAYPLEPGKLLPPLSSLKRRIIIKNKKKHHHHHHKQKPQKKISKSALPENGSESPPLSAKGEGVGVLSSIVDADTNAGSGPDDEDNSSSSDEEDGSAEPEDLKNLDLEKSSSDKETAGKESEAGAEISALVNYVQPVHFSSFENAANRKKCYEMSSFDEKQAMTLLKEFPVEFVNYNKYQLARVYPKGARVDSANFMPQLFWNAGFQLVALNFQTMDLPMQLNLGIFEMNNKSGFLLKPDIMRRKNKAFDPFAESPVDGIVAGRVSIQVISGQFLSDKRTGTFVEVDMYGLPTDTVKKKFRTKTVPLNGINPVYDEEPFVFKKVILPDLACIRIAAYEESGKLIGHRVLPVVALRPGFRHLALRNETGQPLNLPTLFLNITVNDFVPDGFADFADALANPIKQDETGGDDSSTNDDSDMPNIHPSGSTPVLPGFSSNTQTNIPSGGIATAIASTGGISGRMPSVKHKLQHAENSSGSPPPHASSIPIQQKDSLPDSKSIVGPMAPRPPPLAAFGPCSSGEASQTFFPEPLEQYLESKLYKDKKAQLDKKLEEVKKKHDKDVKQISKPKRHQKLVKKISKNNMDVTLTKKDSIDPQQYIREKVNTEKDILMKGQVELYRLMEKTISEAQGKQLKQLNVLEERDNSEVMKWIGNCKKEEGRRLAKSTKDRNELDRLKREVDTALVNKAVSERAKKTKLYEDIRHQLEAGHQDVLRKLHELKDKTLSSIPQDFEERRFTELSTCITTDEGTESSFHSLPHST